MKKLAAAAVMLSVLLAGLPVQAAGNYTIDCNGKKIATPETHIVEKTITTLDGGGALTNPQDIFIDAQDNIYVADTGNNRIVVLDSQGRYLRSYTAGNSLRSPSGVYVAEFGSLFVADTGNERIVNINPDDTVAEVFTKPDSDMLTESSDFAVTKVCLSAQGFLYTLKGQQFMMIDADNQFKGFVGANYLPFSLKRVFVRLFATEEQKQKLEVEEAPPYTNFMIGHDGMLYAVAATSLEKIKKLNVSGKNVFPADYTTEQLYDSDGLPVDTNFVDITVDDHDVISVLEQTSGRIYQYDQEGNLLSVFGGLGDKRGYFRIPVLIAADSKAGCMCWTPAPDISMCLRRPPLWSRWRTPYSIIRTVSISRPMTPGRPLRRSTSTIRWRIGGLVKRCIRWEKRMKRWNICGCPTTVSSTAWCLTNGAMTLSVRIFCGYCWRLRQCSQR